MKESGDCDYPSMTHRTTDPRAARHVSFQETSGAASEEENRGPVSVSRSEPGAEGDRDDRHLTPYQENLLKLLVRIPNAALGERERKIASLIPKRQRAAAVSEEKQRAWNTESYLVGLALRIPAATPAVLESKLISLVPRKRRTPDDPRTKSRLGHRVGFGLLRRAIGEPGNDHGVESAASEDKVENPVVNAFLAFAHFCYARANELKAEAYLAHGVQSLPAAEIVAKVAGGRLYCDVVEMPSFAERSVRYDWHPTNLSLLDHAFDSYLRSSAGLSTIGWALASELARYGPPVTVIPNYRYAEQLQPSDELRQQCGLGPGDVLLLASSTICSGFEPVIEALALLPDNVHLATLGSITREYRAKVLAYPGEIGVRERVHFFDEVPYARLTTVASGANLGVMAIDPSLANDRVSLPNRLFDSIAAGLPIVTPDVPDIARIVNQRNIGVTVAVNEAQCWAAAFKLALSQESEMRPRVLKTARELVWDEIGDEVHAAYGNARSITIFGYGNLVGHQRTTRIAASLAKRGVQVTICCPSYQAGPPPDIPGIRFVLTPHPHSVEANPRPPVGRRPRTSALHFIAGRIGALRGTFARAAGYERRGR